MLYIKANHLTDGLYNIKDGEIFKYKAKGGTVRTYEIGNIVRCKECRHWKWIEWAKEYRCTVRNTAFNARADDYCSYGERREP